jgi:hypothetical protein
MFQLALFSLGRVVCFGAGAVLGRDNGTATGVSPGALALHDLITFGTTDFITQIALRETHACSIVASGRVRCWGSNSSEQLGDATDDPKGNHANVARSITSAIFITFSPLVNSYRAVQVATGRYISFFFFFFFCVCVCVFVLKKWRKGW